ncbi:MULTISPECIES: hypothetical protein [unclassified Streptomyces]|uniref:hypothetical protein n=1 Tax=unclassified Streptomyces TaxID=2593676 RepID=UPI000F6F47B7|nr:MULTISPECIES: hypothetical protein [unclassified Streptomyces]AZM59266.1 hypothetical protein DLM49_06575 [Streptomyces sp. WAC 01438]RSM89293.1 hypothetical protein DMA10_30895 [Streptomyces sp. WAC 01420]
MPDPVYPLPPDVRPPSLGTYNALGTMLLYNSRPDDTGRFFATQWLMILLPIVPLRRYYVREGKITQQGDGSTIEYRIYGTSRIRAIEVIRAYVYFWILLPSALIVPILVAMAHDHDPAGDDVMFVGMFVSVGLILLLLTLLFLHRTFWRPVRPAQWIGPPSPDEEE